MTEKEIREEYRKLLKNPDFDKLELELRKPNIFEILKISRMEIRHSNFLSWLLDPNGSHGLGNIFLIKFLRELVDYEEIDIDLDEFEIEKLDYNTVKIKREQKYVLNKKERNIDMLIIFENLVICIENKIGSKDGINQLSDYKDIVDNTFTNEDQKKVFVYLTPEGEEPNDKEQKKVWIPYSYEGIIKIIDNVLTIYAETINTTVYQYISDYLITLKRELTMGDTNILAAQIYQNHKKLINFVIKNKANIAVMQWQPIIKNKVLTSKWVLGSEDPKCVRFLTPKLNPIIPRKGQGWLNKESFLFQIWFNETSAEFRPYIARDNPPHIKKILCEAMESIKDIDEYKRKLSKPLIDQDWPALYQHKWPWEFEEEITEVDDKTVLEKLNEEWEIIEPIVKKVEDALLTVKDELEPFCQQNKD